MACWPKGFAMIEIKKTYTQDEVDQLLYWQHINTRNAIFKTEPWRVYDLCEIVTFMEVTQAINSVEFKDTDIRRDDYRYEFKDNRQA